MVNPIHFKETYELGRNYRKVKNRARSSLKKYFDCKELYSWDDHKKKITFTSERLIPAHPSGKSRVMLLFSNPHPRSVHMGMFHSYKLPNSSRLHTIVLLNISSIAIMLSPLNTRNNSPKSSVISSMKRFSPKQRGKSMIF